MSKFSFVDKLNLAQLPTPIQKLKRFSLMASFHQDVEVFIKRDDLTHGVATGNKVRKLELLLAEAKRRSARTVFTCGGLQSNHARSTAALCREQGLGCVLFLEGTTPESPTGNFLLDKLYGAEVRYVTREEYSDIGKTFLAASEEFRRRDGVSPFMIPEGGSNDVGGLAYALAFEEISKQGNDEVPAFFDSIVVANGSGGTHAGLLVGRNMMGADSTKIVSFNVSRSAAEMKERTKRVILGTIQRYRLPISLMPTDIHVIDGYVGPGYAKATPELYDWIVKVCRTDGILLDPVYSGKAMYGLLTELKKSPESAEFFGKKILFIHTGGLPSVFSSAHEGNFVAAVARSTDA